MRLEKQNASGTKSGTKNRGQKSITYLQLMRQFYLKNRATLAFALISSLIGAFIGVVISWFLQQTLDTMQGVKGAIDIAMLTYIAIGIVLFAAFIYLIDIFTMPHYIRKALLQYKALAFKKLTEKNIAAFSDENISKYLSALTNDMNTIETEYLNSHVNLLMHSVSFVASFAMMLIYSPLLTLVALVLTFFPILASVLVGGRLAAAEKRVSQSNADFTSVLKDCLNGFKVVKSFKAEKEVADLVDRSNMELEQSKFDRRRIRIWVNLISQTAGIVAQFGVFLAGAYLALSGHAITAGTVVAFVNLMNFVIQPINQLPSIFAGRKAALALVAKLADALDSNVEASGTTEIARLEREIDLKNVSFAYEDGKNVLKGVDICFLAGKSYAIVGGSGSGKSTLLNLLIGSHSDYEGAITFDGVDLRDISTDSLFGLVSTIQQDVFVFDATIEDNITMFKDFSSEEIASAVDKAKLRELINERGQGYLCGENGNGLSGGEKQRIAIARSLIKKSSVLLADEATSSLDAQTASQVVQVLQGLEGMTRIIITHALDKQLLRGYDEIVTMKDGRIVEKGTFDELYESKGYFYALYTVSQ